MSDYKPLNVLVIEDSDDDAILICEELKRGAYNPHFDRIETADALKRALSVKDYDVIISDYTLPQFTALEALRIVKTSGKDVPVIVVSGSVREHTIVEVMRAGARDYVMKENLTRLPLAGERELAEAIQRRERRQFEEQLRHTQRLESLGVLAGGVAHDFNNLLTGILGSVSLAIEEAPPASPLRPLLDQAVQAAEQAANLTRQMLAYAGKGRFFIEPVDLSVAATEISALLDASVSKNISFIFELHEALPAVEGDRGQLQQVLMNLVINAAEAIGADQPGTIILTTGCKNLTESDLSGKFVRDQLSPGEYVFVRVRDTGTGIDSAVLPRIFDPFFSTKFTGRGLGLSAVMGIVRSHHGTLQVSSDVGKGSTFTIYLPAHPHRPARLLREPAAQLSMPHAVVLVIDDEEVIRRTAKAILEKRGLHVFLAETGRAGVEAFRRLADRIAVVLLDLTMPSVSGADVLRELKALRADVPILVSSGYDEAEAMRRVPVGEVAGFIQKPYTAPHLLEKIRSVLKDSTTAETPELR